MVRIVDACQTQIVVIVGDELAFLGKVGSLLGQHIAERIISETGNAACRLPSDVETILTLNADGTYLLIQAYNEK